MCAHMCEGDEDTITRKHTPQNGISGLSASKPSKETIAFPVWPRLHAAPADEFDPPLRCNTLIQVLETDHSHEAPPKQM